MIHVVEAWLRRTRRALSRDEWSWKLLRLKPAEITPGRGLLLIQIDGLSRPQLEKALRRNRMPFLSKLLRKEGYRLHSVYSGIPSTTAAAQGELFYGRKCCVPAFAFRDRRSGENRSMLNAHHAGSVERDLNASEAGILKGGSAYSNIFTGGAVEPHFCASQLSMKKILTGSSPLRTLTVLVWNFPAVLRLCVLLGVEAGLGIYDALRGTLARGELRYELNFILSRVLVCVGLRETVTAMASMDLMRGLPVVQLNFPGYDEQSHRRGPSSAFAHFSLRGIDASMRRLWNAAHRTARRDYEIWIYSDHGQENSVPYLREYGRTLENAVQATLGRWPQLATNTTEPQASSATDTILPRRVVRSMDPLGTRVEGYLMRDRNLEETLPKKITVLALGPIGHIYLPIKVTEVEKAAMAHALLREAGIPVVLYTLSEGQVMAVSAQGAYTLPQNAASVLGKGHPFLSECAQDLAEACQHPNAGDFIITGWSPGHRPMTFAWENGAHGGPGTHETHAFALIPKSVKFSTDQPYLRHQDLHTAVHRLKKNRGSVRATSVGEVEKVLRVMTYNVHACDGMDGKTRPDRIARVIAEDHPDVICLQECYGADRGNLTQQVCRELEHEFHYPTLHVLQDGYGNAIVSVFPLVEKGQNRLPTLQEFQLETRGAQWAEFQWEGQAIQILNTHLGLSGRERELQAKALVGEEWIASARRLGPLILGGDFNAGPQSPAYQILAQQLVDAQAKTPLHKPRNTFFGRYPISRIDHVFMGPEFKVKKARVSRSQLARLASDHLPLLIELELTTNS